jgi:uncharacterized membrane protein YeaQ/YmgE (transglycosylase-associated protein family)
MNKMVMWTAVAIGSIVGGLIPTMFGASAFGVASILGGTVGAFIGIYLAYKFIRNYL